MPRPAPSTVRRVGARPSICAVRSGARFRSRVDARALSLGRRRFDGRHVGHVADRGGCRSAQSASRLRPGPRCKNGRCVVRRRCHDHLGADQFAATASATFDVTGLCVFGGTELPGTSQVPLVMRQFDESERLCQRYYFRRNSNGTADIIGLGQAVSTTLAFPPADLIFPFRSASPTAVNLSSIGHFILTGGAVNGNA